MFQISSVRHMYPEKAGFFIDRREGHRNYTFLHFHNSVEIRLDGKMIQTEPHSVILFRPGTPQFFRSTEPLLHDWFHFSGDWDEIPLPHFQPDTLYYPARHSEITKAVAVLETEFFAKETGADLLMDCKIREFFIRLDRNLETKEGQAVQDETRKKFRYLRGEMFSSLDQHFSVSDLAQRVSLSPSRFYSLYRKIYGTSPNSDLILARIRSAKNKLLYEEISIDEIAVSLGYENTTHFIRQFKARVGTTPARYRAEKRKE